MTTRSDKGIDRQAAVPGRPVVDPAAWMAEDLQADPRWIFKLSEADVGALMAMARSVRSVIGDDPNGLLAMPASAFDAGAFGETIAAIRHELKDGFGAALVRGLPMESMHPLDAAIIYWGIGRHLGVATSNNPEGDMLGHVTDLGKTQKDANSRGYQTREEMAYHCDQSTLVGLLCVRTPRSGGQSRIASSVSVYNTLVERSAAHAAVLCRPYCWTKHGEANPGEPGYYESPVFNFLDDKLCVSLGPTHMVKGHQVAGAPPMTDEQREALEEAKAIAHAQHFSMELRRGDMQFLNNEVVVHTRTAYEDWEDPGKKRLLWRLWLNAYDVRPATPYIKQWGVGVKVNSTLERIVL